MTKPGGWEETGFGEAVRRLREDAGKSQQDAAKDLGIAASSYAAIERGETQPSWPLVLRVCRLYGVPCETFSRVADVGTVDTPPPKRKPGRPRKEAGPNESDEAKAVD